MEHRREDRYVVQVAGRYRARHGDSRDVWIKDLSEYGCRFFDKFSVLTVGSRILIKAGNVGPIPADVKWRDGSTVGAEFENPLHPSVLDHIVRFMDESDADEAGATT